METKTIAEPHVRLLRMLATRRIELERELAEVSIMRSQVLMDAAATVGVPVDAEVRYNAEDQTLSYEVAK